MSNYLIKGETLTDIANAIRTKTGKTDSIATENMATEISGIEDLPLYSGAYEINENGQEGESPLQAEYRQVFEGTAEEIHIPEGTTKLRNYAFYPSLPNGVTVHIPNSVTFIEHYLFSGDHTPAKLKYAGSLEQWYALNFALINEYYYLFINNELVTEINNITNFDKYYNNAGTPFSSLSGLILEKLFIPNDSKLPLGALSSICANQIIFEGNIDGELPRYAFRKISKFKNDYVEKLVLPTNITTIPKYCFYDARIKEIEIPEGVTKIEASTFSNAMTEKVILPSTLTLIDQISGPYDTGNVTIVVKATTPPRALGKIFYSTPKEIQIPKGTLAAYQAATNWATYSSVFVEMEE